MNLKTYLMLSRLLSQESIPLLNQLFVQTPYHHHIKTTFHSQRNCTQNHFRYTTLNELLCSLTDSNKHIPIWMLMCICTNKSLLYGSNNHHPTEYKVKENRALLCWVKWASLNVGILGFFHSRKKSDDKLIKKIAQ